MEKRTFKIWTVIEECITDTETGEETFVDHEDCTRSLGMYNTLEEAEAKTNEIGDLFEGDFTT